MSSFLRTAALAALTLGLSAGSGFAQAYPRYPRDYQPGNAGVMGVGPGGREAYHPMYYSVAPGYGYYPSYPYLPNITGLPSYPIANPDVPLPSGNQLEAHAPPPASDPNAATIDVLAPPDARLWFQGQETRQQGPQRFFESPPLRPGENYSYKVKVQWIAENGETVERTRTIRVRAGAHITLDLRGPAS